MTEEFVIQMLNNFGFPVAVTVILLWDKLKSNGSLLKVVNNNNELLTEIKKKLC